MPSYKAYDQRYKTAYEAGLQFLNHQPQDHDLLRFILANNLQYARVLELGCGEGFEARSLAELGCDVVGIDCSLHAVNTARQFNRHLGVRFECFDAVRDSLNNCFGQFQAAYDIGCFHVLQNQSERQTYLKHIIMALKPNGVFFLCAGLLNSDGFFEPPVHNEIFDPITQKCHRIIAQPPIYPLTQDAYVVQLETAGFNVLRIRERQSKRVYPLEIIIEATVSKF